MLHLLIFEGQILTLRLGFNYLIKHLHIADLKCFPNYFISFDKINGPPACEICPVGSESNGNFYTCDCKEGKIRNTESLVCSEGKELEKITTFLK